MHPTPFHRDQDRAAIPRSLRPPFGLTDQCGAFGALIGTAVVGSFGGSHAALSG